MPLPETTPPGSYRLAMDTTVLHISAAFARLHGYRDVREFRQQTGNDKFNPYANPAQQAQVQVLLIAHGRVRNFASRWICHRTGATLWVRESACLVRSHDQSPAYYDGTARDISKEHHTLRSLQHHDTMLHRVLNKLAAQVWLKNLYGNYLACNEPYASALGRPVEHIVGTVDADHPDAAIAAHYCVADEAVIRLGQPVRYEVKIRNPDLCGYTIHEIIKAPVRGHSGAVTGVLGMVRKIPGRRPLQTPA